MKKLLAITVIFALVAGAAFAQASIGGELQAGFNVLSSDGTNTFVGEKKVGDNILRASVSTDTAGALVRWDGLGGLRFASFWWAPIEQVRFDFGDDGFGGGRDGITGWGFLAVPKTGGGAAHEGWGGSTGFYGSTGWDVDVFGFTFNFVENLTIKAALRNVNNQLATKAYIPDLPDDSTSANGFIYSTSAFGATDKKKNDILDNLSFQIIYDLPGLGNLSVATLLGTGSIYYIGEGQGTDTGKIDIGSSGMKFFADFLYNGMEGLEAQLGLAYTLGAKGNDITYTAPMEIGLGVKFESGDFGVKARIGAELLGKVEDAKLPTVIHIGLLPYYNVSGYTIFGHFGFDMTMPDEGDNVIGWYINPYVQIPIDAFNFWIGFKVWSGGAEGEKAKWAVPITAQFNF